MHFNNTYFKYISREKGFLSVPQTSINMFLKNNYINVKHIVAKFNLKNKTFRVYDNVYFPRVSDRGMIECAFL